MLCFKEARCSDIKYVYWIFVNHEWGSARASYAWQTALTRKDGDSVPHPVVAVNLGSLTEQEGDHVDMSVGRRQQQPCPAAFVLHV